MSRSALTLPAVLAAITLAACRPAAIPEPPTASLRMRGAPAEATVTIDDHIVGSFEEVAARGVALPLGKHRITVQAPGYFPWDREVEAKEEGKRIEIDVKLIAVPY